MNPINQLKNKIMGKGSPTTTLVTDILFMARELSCVPDIIGRKFEIKKDGKVVYTIEQKPMSLSQLNTLMKEFDAIKKIDAEIEKKKFGGKRR